ncbi:MAG: hypothetical protein WBW79_00305 [Desulfocapsaceae bacterium]
MKQQLLAFGRPRPLHRNQGQGAGGTTRAAGAAPQALVSGDFEPNNLIFGVLVGPMDTPVCV